MEKTAPLFVLQIVRRVVTPTDFVLVKQDGRALIVPQVIKVNGLYFKCLSTQF